MEPYQPPPPPVLELQLENFREQQHAVSANPYHRVQQILQAISRTVPRAERHELLESTLQFLSHEDVDLHDYEIDMGADRALCLQLGYLDMLQTASPTNNGSCRQIQTFHWNDNANHKEAQSSSEQILICWCLTKVYQCSREQRLRSFHEIGLSDMVPILTKILKRCCVDKTAKSGPENHRRALSQHMDMMVPVLRILRIFAKLDSHIKSSLLRRKDGRLLAVLVDILATPNSNGIADNSNLRIADNSNLNNCKEEEEEENHLIRQSVVAMESLGVLKDLSFRLNDNDKEYMYRFLRDTLVHYSLNASDNSASNAVAHASLRGKLLESVAAMCWNFATAPQLSFEMAQQTTLLKSLGRLLQYQGREGTLEEEDIKIKRNALSAFGNLVAALTRESRGMVLSTTPTRSEQEARNNAAAFRKQDWILGTLSQLLRGESDRDIQRRAMRTVRCLAARAWGRTFLWGSSDLKSCLIMVLKDSNNVFDIPTRIQACETIICLSQDPTIMEQSSAIFEKALFETIAQLKDQQKLEKQALFIVASCRASLLCLERRPCGQDSCFPVPAGFFASLLACAKVEKEDTHPPIAQLLLKLATTDNIVATQQSGDQSATQKKCPFWEEAMLSPPVLDTITELLLATGPLFFESHSKALDLIHHFLRKPQNKRVLAKNAELLSAMVEFLLVSDQDDKKKLAKSMVLEIVPEI